MARREDVARGRALEDPLERWVPEAPQVGRDAHPVVVHVQGERRGRRVAGQAARFLHQVRHRKARPAKIRRQREPQVAGIAQLLEVLVEERVVAVVARRPLTASLQQLVRQNGLRLV